MILYNDVAGAGYQTVFLVQKLFNLNQLNP